MHRDTRITRNSNVELLRFMLMISICVWHLLVHGLDIKNVANNNLEISSFSYFLLSLTVPCVNAFMLISGYYGLKLSSKIFKLSAKCLLYFVPISILLIYLRGESVDYNTILFITKHLFTLSSNIWWFMTDYTILLFLSPIINTGVSLLSKKQFQIVLLSLLFINSVALYFNYIGGGSNVQSLLIIYLLGRYISIYGHRVSTWKVLICWLSSIILLFVSLMMFDISGRQYKIWWFLFYNNPLVIIQSVSLFLLVIQFQPTSNKLFLFLGKHSLSIYLITELLGMYLYGQWAQFYLHHSLRLLLFIPLTCIVCVLIDAVQDKIINWVFSHRIINNNLDKFDNFVQGLKIEDKTIVK